MENYPILFPCPSSSCSSYQITTSEVGVSHHGFSGMNNSHSSKPIMGLRPSHGESIEHDQQQVHISEQVHRDGVLFHHENSGRSINNESDDVVGDYCRNDENKKKDEKKVKKGRYAFQTRSEVDILDDGYRWRKYGQKAVKNNKFPRSYYRCTNQECKVKKQVQRLTKDESVVVTTYEGMHTHPLQNKTDNFEHILSQMQIYITT